MTILRPRILHQPPPPLRRSTAIEKGEEKERTPPPLRRYTTIEKGEEEEERNTGQQTGYCLRRCERRKSLITNMESSSSSLPDDLWIEILAQLPAKDVYDLARLVCWKWYRMIYTHTFIYANLQYTPYGLIFRCREDTAYFVTMQQGRIETSKLDYPFSSPSFSTCNGLTSKGARGSNKIFHIANPLTKQVFVLPPTIDRRNSWFCGVGYASVSMEYKAVVTSPVSKDRWAILTPGVDSSWRVVRTDHIHYFTSILARPPLITEGFMHWTFDCNRNDMKIGNQVLTLDVETEIVTKSCVPLNYDGEYDHWTYLSTGRYLTVLITFGKCLWEVWEMKSGNGGGEWRKMDGVVIDLGTQMFEQFGFDLVPVGWLKYLEMLVFRAYSRSHSRVYVYLYNLLTKETNLFELPNMAFFVDPVVHKNSLVWLAGC